MYYIWVSITIKQLNKKVMKLNYSPYQIEALEAKLSITHKWSNGIADFEWTNTLKVNHKTESGRINYTLVIGYVNGNDPKKSVYITETKTVTEKGFRDAFENYKNSICGEIVKSNCGAKK